MHANYLSVRRQRWTQFLDQSLENVILPTPKVHGVLTRISGLTMEAKGINCKIGTRCLILFSDEKNVEAEVVGFASGRTFLMAVDKAYDCSPGMKVLPKEELIGLPVGERLVGHVLDGNGDTLDGKPLPAGLHRTKLLHQPINPLMREIINEPLDVGVRAINSFANNRPWPANRPDCSKWSGQECVAKYDDPLYQCAHYYNSIGRRTWPGGARVFA